MTWMQALIVFFTLWWIVFLAALPFGVKRLENPAPLHDPGAPEKPHFMPKIIITTLLSAALTLAMMVALNEGWIRLESDAPHF